MKPMKMVIEDHPPYRSYRPTWRYRLWRWMVASEIPLALVLVSCVFLAGVCLLTALFMVTR